MTPAPRYRVLWTETAVQMLTRIEDRRVRQLVWERAKQLEHDPEKQGKALTAELAGFRSLRAVGQRFRIIYSVNRADVTVHVAAAGPRKHKDKSDVYAVARKLLKQGLLK